MVLEEELGRGPERIVSIAPSLTEACAALGLAERVVGRTQFCLHPPAVSSAAVVGAQTDTNLEKILALRPDLIIITAGSRNSLEQRLKSLGLRVEVMPDQTIADVFETITQLGRISGRPRTAQKLIDLLVTDLERLSEHGGDHRGTRVLFTFSDLPLRAGPIFAAGPGGHMDELLSRAGYTNAALGVVDKPWAQISAEAIIQARPDVILEFRPASKKVDPQVLYNGWSSLQMVPAISGRRIRSLESPTVLIPGPRINVALYEVIEALSGT